MLFYLLKQRRVGAMKKKNETDLVQSYPMWCVTPLFESQAKQEQKNSEPIGCLRPKPSKARARCDEALPTPNSNPIANGCP